VKFGVDVNFVLNLAVYRSGRLCIIKNMKEVGIMKKVSEAKLNEFLRKADFIVNHDEAKINYEGGGYLALSDGQRHVILHLINGFVVAEIFNDEEEFKLKLW